MYYRGESLRQLLALLRIPGVGPVTLSDILDHHPDLNGVFDSKGNCLLMAGSADWESVDKDLLWLRSANCHMVTKKEATYPALLKEIHGMPPVLFVRGDVKLLSRPQIAMVGSRNPTPMGVEIALKFAQHFSKKGFTVTSGLAIGIDGAAHKGALLGLGGTVAVLGNGLDRIYPASHQTLALEIAEKGALVSEFPIGIPPIASHFPRRNRVISGLSVGVLVVEATLNSGSLITAKLALEQGREVFAIPGSIHSPLAKGCNALIREGAKLVETADDVLEELGAMMKYVIRANDEEVVSQRLPLLEPPYETLLAQVGYECTAIDTVVSRSGLTAQAVSSMLLELELKGYVASVPGGYARLLV
jgi:DNA processing protein